MKTTTETPAAAEGIDSDSPCDYQISSDAHRLIAETVGSNPAETGGMLGGCRKTKTITHFHFDDTARRTGATYSPDHKLLNRILNGEWKEQGIEFLGFIHSHPGQFGQPSHGDEVYAERILQAIPRLDMMFMPIITLNRVGDQAPDFAIHPFVAQRADFGVGIEPVKLVVTGKSKAPDEPETETVAIENDSVVEVSGDSEVPNTFTRVRDAYDLDRLHRSRLVIVGAGGARGFIEECARAGVGEMILIDPDTYSVTNVGTQQCYLDEVGEPKVEVIKRQVHRIYPEARVWTYQKKVEDIADEEFELLLKDELASDAGKPEAVLLCGFTDNFPAQDKVHRLALEQEVPSLCAQVYLEGRACEITFTHPETTEACHRCMLSPRYRYYESGETSNITSAGCPIFATTRLNAIKGFVALAILHHGTDHPRYGEMLERIGSRNLLQVRLDPDLGETLGIKRFDKSFAGGKAESLFFDETLWVPQEPEADCPYCSFLQEP